MRGVAAVWLAAVVLVAGCGDAGTAPEEPTESTDTGLPDVAWADGMRPEPAAVAPGSELALHFQEGFDRGVSFWLERRADGGWTRVYQAASVNSETEVRRPQTVAPPGSMAVPDVAVHDAGPDVVLVPDSAEPGQWRVCLGEHPSVCAPFDVVEAP